MKNSKLYYGDTVLNSDDKKVLFDTVDFGGETYFKIENYDQMNPFFMTIVSPVDFWTFVSSTGGITAGRKSPDHAFFPYYTDDKIHDSHTTTGSHTSIIVRGDDKSFIWNPFNMGQVNLYKISRNIYKNTMGNKLVFEEVNHDLSLSFRYTWKTSDLYGLVKESELVNNSDDNISVEILDGIRNILPYGVDQMLQMSKSTLVDGYKRNELLEDSGLGLFTLSSIITDKAEPSESLKCTSVWSKGLMNPKYLLSTVQVDGFMKGDQIETERDIKGRRGGFYVSDSLDLDGQSSKKWVIVSELNQSASDIENLIHELKDECILSKLSEDINKGDQILKNLVFEADGLQISKHSNNAHRHFSNTLYNIMRGGIYADAYKIDVSDLKLFISSWNKDTYNKYVDFLDELGSNIDYKDLLIHVKSQKDLSLERLIYEYLPLTYSRRHGDPSRPWNKFNIEVTKENGDKNLNYEGNWRDIFQNWEALSLSYPLYLGGIISKFVNASTPDGYNPYRITKDGIDWEVLDPEDPWSNIGYWGDHQVIYLQKLMELSRSYNSDELDELLSSEIFAYANVPYRIKGFEDLLADPRNTILFDDISAGQIEERVESLGADGKLVFVNDDIYQVNLMEKILVMLLAKLSNYVPEGGIWLNTQRPEWNDANNALVGGGVSMVTLYYMHRMVMFMSHMVENKSMDFSISSEVVTMFERIFEVFNENSNLLGKNMDDNKRFEIVRALGSIGQTYRESIYSGFSGHKATLSSKSIESFFEVVAEHLKDTIKKNKREDGLYHAYNLLEFEGETCKTTYLYEMLEGQVAVLSSNALKADEALDVIKHLKNSDIYRDDQNSFMLYPNRDLAKFLDKNIIPKEKVMSSSLLKTEVEKGLSRFVEKDRNGNYHFNGLFRNGDELVEAIIETNEYSENDAKMVGLLFSDLFDHRAFTGRSGTFYKYEGLGCIYWHMVSKLVLACGENQEFAQNLKDKKDLSAYFHDLKAGIGVDKSPEEYGAFPTDAYSHTPGFAGVQQPGMTGQVKEDILSRFKELGVHVTGGELNFNPTLLSSTEFLDQEKKWTLPEKELLMEKNQLGFTVCTVPVVYTKSNYQSITVCYQNGDRYTFENTSKLTREISQSVFERKNTIDKILVNVDQYNLSE
ncbi:hypothetical protein EZV73_20430 [Acidaminobacter sp. JC074]|uniref:hypothetical protein n=1 Tax=Acidaminobacter sp. JC074 TaxID=2530199 RepID=UPI001F0D0C4A|nr:hypothetical protein [Acidaminobacter sp. JC074]MCH4889958.1 hypothetical protein [Acidaminobacter sp. JC074]